ncbi:MAG TPA: signal peptidase I [Pyrinomonadaceae bacterium]|nr:signal peptidase I [Pyrinomonadaceae bacterium]
MDNEQTGAGVAEPPAERDATGATAHTTGAGEAHETDGRRADGGGRNSPAAPHRAHGVLREYFESLVVTAIMALFGMTFVVQAVKVPTGSMQNTILIGDHLLVNKFIFAPGADDAPFFLPQREIRRGDIIVFKYPGNQFDPDTPQDRRADNTPFKTNYVKRVIGLPGDTVEVRGDRVYINGSPLPERRVTATDPGASSNDEDDLARHAPLVIRDRPPADEDGDYTVYYSPETRLARDGSGLFISPDFHFAVRGKPEQVPEGHYFVMGDNRENSLDSRAWGFVPRELVIGRALFVYWSYDESQPRSDAPYVGYLVDFVRNTRWSRTGTLVK